MLLSGLIEEAKGQLNQTYATHIHPEFKELPELASDLEEADMRIIPHINWQLLNFPGCTEVLVESNDTDVVVLLIFYFRSFMVAGLKDLWIHFGKGRTPPTFLCTIFSAS